MKRIIDIHCHPSFKAHNQILYEDKNYSRAEMVKKIDEAPFTLWDEVPADPEIEKSLSCLLKSELSGYHKTTQSDLNKLQQGKLKVAFFSLHPFEMGWLRIKDEVSASLLYLLTQFNRDKTMMAIGRAISGTHQEKVKMLRNKVRKDLPIDYFEELFKEYLLVAENERKGGPNGEKLSMIQNFEEYKAAIEEPNTQIGIFTIEGGHAFSFLPEAKALSKRWSELPELQRELIREHYLNNIQRLKGKPAFEGDDKYFDKRHIPLYVTLTHMFYNFLAGHCKTFTNPLCHVFGQKNGSTKGDTGITDLGWEVIHHLLEKGPQTKRILIDVKHMAFDSRKAYYEFVRNKRDHENDLIPIICSHAAVTGFDGSYFDGDTETDHKNYYLSALSINLFREDIEEIIQSDGLIGLVTHEGRMPGKKVKKELKTMAKLFKEGKISRKELAGAYVKLVMTNLFYIIHTIDQHPEMEGKKAWDHLCLGSDYDGIMDPFDLYPTSVEFMSLFGEMKEFLEHPEPLNELQGVKFSVRRIKELMYDYSAEDILEKLAYKNVENFLRKYFTDEYLYKKARISVRPNVLVK